MPNERISMSKLKQLIGLQSSNLSVRALSRALGLSVGAVSKYLRALRACRIDAGEAAGDCQKFCVLSPVDLTIDLEPIAEHHGKLRLCRTPFASRHLPLLGDLAQL